MGEEIIPIAVRDMRTHIQRYIKKNKTTLEQLSNSIGLVPKTLEDILAGRTMAVDYRTIQKVADTLGLSVKELLEG